MDIKGLRPRQVMTALAGGVLAAAIAAPALAVDVTNNRLLNADKEPQNWLMVHGEYNSNRYSRLDQINRGNVGSLHVAFAVAIGGIKDAGGQIEANPLVDGGFLYQTDAWGTVYKIDGRSGTVGRILWKMDPGVDESIGALKANRGPALWKNQVIVATIDGRLISTDIETGEVLWDVASTLEPAESHTVAPIIAKSQIIVGQTAGDWGTRGWLGAFDADTGENNWRFWMVPGPGEPGHETWADDWDAWKTGGGAPWVTGSYDPETNLTLWGTGNPVPMFDPEFRPGDNLYTDSVVAINVDTGKLAWYFQYTPNEAWDYDEEGVHLLYNTMINGVERSVVGHFSRSGFYYNLDRLTGEFINATQYVAEVNWTAGIDPKTGKPVEYDPNVQLQAYARGINPRRVADEDGQPIVEMCPTAGGGVNYQPTAHNPMKGLSYGIGAEGCGAMTVVTEEPVPGGGNPKGYGKVFAGGIFSGEGKSPRSWGALTAVDVTTGQIAAKATMDQRSNSGVLATAGGLVFAGERDGSLTAWDDETLTELWTFNTGCTSKSSPISYSVGGKQFIAITMGAGNGGPDELSNMNKCAILFVFSL